MSKVDNLPNLPECHPFKDLGSILNGKVYEKNWKQKRISKYIKEIDIQLLKVLAKPTRLRMRRARTNGLKEDNNYFNK